jgi:hypothetical protein
MNGFAWTTLIVAGMVGAFLFVAIGAILLVLLLANVSDRLTRNDEDHRS